MDELSRSQDVLELRVKHPATVADVIAFNERYRGTPYAMTSRYGQKYAQELVGWLAGSNLGVLEEQNISTLLDGFSLR